LRKSVDDTTKIWHTATPADTEALGGRFAAGLPADRGDLVVVYLTGDLGAGKTTFARGFLRAAGITGPIRSPTYTLLEPYEAALATVAHLDLFRLRDASELEPLGLRDLALPGHLWLVEWPERGAGWLPSPDLSIVLSVGTAAHRIEAHGRSAPGRTWLARISA
jgi:tRNA threonylcarbamoyladenosine biosynthesis protein TsaE